MDTNDLEVLKNEFNEDIHCVKTILELEECRVKWLGASKGIVKNIKKKIKTYEGESKIQVAQSINQFSRYIEETFKSVKDKLQKEEIEQKIQKEWIDISLPSTAMLTGALHPVRVLELKCLKILENLGFESVQGPEIETSFYNFDALNIPEYHPARDLQDTFWINENYLLRTHTTSVQARILDNKPNFPIKAVVSGRVYRNEAIDATHLAMFHQLDGFWVDKDLNFSHLKGIIKYLAEAIYGDSPIRFKPKYYPYTEPSVGVDIQCQLCMGIGCIACHQAGWVTIMGAGMIHKKVLLNLGYDSDDITGIAFGWGLSRMTSQMYELTKLRPLYQGDIRLLKSIKRAI